MRSLICLVVALVPAVASAGKTYNEGEGGTWDCAKDASVIINANEGTYTFTGACTSISVNGNENKITVGAVAKLVVNGNKNTVDAGSADAIATNGNDNTVTYKKGSPKIANPGNRNAIKRPAATKGGGSAPAPASAPTATAAIDCAKEPNQAIADGGGTYRFVGACEKLSVAGGENTISIESVKELVVAGSKNTIDVGATDKIASIGADNTVRYKKGLSGEKPKVSNIGHNNKVTQVK